MTLLLMIAVGAALGYVVTFPIVRRGLSDVGRIPGAIWRITGYTNRRTWRVTIIGGYLLGGWPGAVVVLIWRRSEARAVLREEWHLLIEERRARHEIVLAHYEEPADGGGLE